MDISFQELRLIIDAPQFIEPWLDRFYEPVEMLLLMTLKKREESFEFLHQFSLLSPEDMERLWRRGVVTKRDNHYKAATFHIRYDIWAMFEGFKDIPPEIRDKINQWEFDHYCQKHEQTLTRLVETADPDKVNDIVPQYLLLDEAVKILDKAERVYLWPCNCRSMVDGCKKPVYTCIRFENERSIGFEISREKAKEIVVDSNKKGLMQSGEIGKDSRGKLIGAICNCCADCCFPHQLSRQKRMEKIWPFSRYIAKYIEEKCIFCGLCSKRCPFGAFMFEKKRANRSATLSFVENLCRGCGICATGCPTEAIEMISITGR